MRFSTCRTEISLSISARHFSSRLAIEVISSTACLSAIFTERCEATVSASLPGSSIWVDRRDDLRRNLLVELHIAFELGDDRARQSLGLDQVDRVLGVTSASAS